MIIFSGQEEFISVTGIVHKSVQLPCNLNISDPPAVEWNDLVYNLDSNPSKIFTSTNYSSINVYHTNWLNYEVDSEYTLTINLLDLESDPGKYYCQSTMNNETFVQSYYLTIGG